MLSRNLVEPARLRELFEQIRPRLDRYPAVDPPSFQRALEATLSGA
jgi:hypothetical protein